MFQREGQIVICHSDMAFVKKFGLEAATRMFVDFSATHAIPFIYDTRQLARVVGLRRRNVLHLWRNSEYLYKAVKIPKKDGSLRQLQVPDDSLKTLQYQILFHILRYMPVSDYATAYRKKEPITRNAAPHVGKKYLLKMDITDFFGSITQAMLMRYVFHRGNFPAFIGVMLTELCTHEDALPQGAPTSPALSNLVMKRFDEKVGEWCQARGVAYTRYCDDMTFSGNEPLGFVYAYVKEQLASMGFGVNPKKTRFVTNAGRMSVTGLTVNEKISVNKPYKRSLRQEVYYVLQYGAESALTHTGKAFDSPLQYVRHLMGKTAYVLQVEPEHKWFRQAFCDLQCKMEELDYAETYSG